MAHNRSRTKDDSLDSDSGFLEKSTTLGFAAGNSFQRQTASVVGNPERRIEVQLFADYEDDASGSFLRQKGNTEKAAPAPNVEKKQSSSVNSSQRYGSGRSFNEENAGARLYQADERDFANRQASPNRSVVLGPEKDVRSLQDRYSIESNQNANADELKKSLLQQLDIVREARRGLSNEIALVESDLQQESNRLRQLRTIKQELLRKCTEIEQERIKLEDDLEKTRTDVKLIFDQAQDLKTKKKSLVMKREKLAQVCREFDAQNQDFIQAIVKENQTVQEIEQMSHRLELELSELIKIKKTKLEEVQIIQESLSLEKKTIVELEDKYNKMEIQTQAAQDSIAQLRKLIYSSEEHKNTIQRELEAAHSKKLEIEQQPYSSQVAKAKLDEKIREIKTEILKSQTDTETAQGESIELKARLGEYQIVLRQAATEVEKRQATLTELDSQHIQVREVLEDLKLQYKKTQENYTKSLAEVERAQHEVRSLNEKVKELSEKRDAHLQEKEVAMQKREELNSYFALVQQNQDHIAGFQKAIDELHEILSASQEKKQSLESTLTNARQSIKEVQEANAKLTANITDFMAAKTSKEKENERIRKEVEEAKSSIIGMEQSIQSEQRDLELLTTRFRGLQIRHDDIIIQKSKMEESIVTLSESFQMQRELLAKLEVESRQRKEEVSKLSSAVQEQERINKRLVEDKISLEESHRESMSQREELLHSIQTWKKKNEDIQGTISGFKSQMDTEESKCKMQLMTLKELEGKHKEAHIFSKEIEEKRNTLLQQIRDCEQRKNQMNDEILSFISLLRSEKEILQDSQLYANRLKRDLEETKASKSKLDELIKELQEVKLMEEEQLQTSKIHHSQMATSIRSIQDLRGSKEPSHADYGSGYLSRTSAQNSQRNIYLLPPRAVDARQTLAQTRVDAEDSQFFDFESSINDSSFGRHSKIKADNTSHIHDESIDLVKILTEGGADSSLLTSHRGHESAAGLDSQGPTREYIDGILSRLSEHRPITKRINSETSNQPKATPDPSLSESTQKQPASTQAQTRPSASSPENPAASPYLYEHNTKHSSRIESEAESERATRAEYETDRFSSTTSTRAGAFGLAFGSTKTTTSGGTATSPSQSQSPNQSRLHLSHLLGSAKSPVSGSKTHDSLTGQAAYFSFPSATPPKRDSVKRDQHTSGDITHEDSVDETVNQFLRSQIFGSNVSSPLAPMLSSSAPHRIRGQDAFDEQSLSPMSSPSTIADRHPTRLPNTSSSEKEGFAGRSSQNTSEF